MKKTLATAVILATLVVLPPPADATAPPGPPLSVPTSTLAAALDCSTDIETSERTPVLLIPGTVESSAEVYSWGYQRVLRQAGHPVCTIDELPDYGLGDMQRTAEYVVHAIRTMHATSGQKVSLLGHSQGGALSAWALRFWPDLAAMVDDSITLESPYRGVTFGELLCRGLGTCPALAWQVAPSSAMLKALRSKALPDGPSYTAIGSLTDELASGSPADWEMPGLTPLLVQSLCPGRIVGHITSLYDNAAYAIVKDALDHPGGASLARISSSVCGQAFFDGIDWTGFSNLVITFQQVIEGATNLGSYVGAEPMVRAYAAGEAGDTNLALNRPVSVSSTECCWYSGANAVDGNLGTRWASQWWQDPQTIRVDLGTTRTVNAVQIRWEDAYAKSYTVQVSNDGLAWTTAHSTTSGQGRTELVQLPGIQARYARLRLTQRGSNYGYSLYEFQVIGH